MHVITMNSIANCAPAQIAGHVQEGAAKLPAYNKATLS